MTTDSKENGQKLRISERLWAMSQQPFARPFCFGPVGNTLSPSLIDHSVSSHKKTTL
jgi:hypothetical protein